MAISSRLSRLVLALAALAPAACDTPESVTDLNPDGPPMIQQVFMKEPDATGRIETVLAFGTHPMVPTERTRVVTKASPMKQYIRVVFDELLLGNYLEEVQCNARTGVVDCPLYSHIPEGTTPDDIANCADADPDILDARCTGAHTVCMNPDNVPCGIRDEDQPSRPADGAPDDLRLIAGAVIIRCGTIDIGFEEATSFWQPSGNQLVPAGMTPETSLGPALVLYPVENGALPTSQTDCHLRFAPNVVDKDHIRICTPAGGTLDGACTPGDVSGFSFGTEELRANSTTPSDQETDVALNSSIRISLNAEVDLASLPQSVVVREGGNVRADAIVIRADTADKNRIDISLPGGLRANTVYTITATPKDFYGIAAPAPITFTFTTGA